ncbi:MAG: gluconate 2-dehydrogenase subunit 3 family protein [Gemmatimonadaceae bacterium]|nr:gluconate 2-dehydrogenase subunit 3 family protein [Gemmatimonadaceae bacterium]
MATSRRSFIISAAGLGAAWLATDWALVEDALAHAARSVTQPPPAFTALSAAEARDLDAMAQRIVPTTETPGAKEAGVIFFIDKALATFDKAALPEVRRGLADLRARATRRQRGAASFAALPVRDQDAILAAIEKTPFFEQMRTATMVGMFGDPKYGGNRDRIGWKIIGFDPQPVHRPPFGYYDAPLQRGGKKA